MSTSSIKLVVIADQHGNLPTIPKADMVLIGGDITPYLDETMQAQWLDTVFREWLKSIDGEVVAVCGNHDHIFEQTPHLIPKDLPWHYLQDSMITIKGLNIYGSPWQPVYLNWAFNADEPFLKSKWSHIPENTDILLLHGPPLEAGDLVGGEHVGSPSLRQRILEVQPLLEIHGHIHEGRGLYYISSDSGYTTCLNATLVDTACDMVYKPIVVEIENKKILSITNV